MSRNNIGLFIDAENVSQKRYDFLIQKLTGIGHVCIKKAFGDWNQPSMRQWQNSLSNNGIVPVHQETLTKGKNAADIAIAIDVLDTLSLMGLKTICIMSSDSDFTPLVNRCVARGITVIGAGESKAPQAFKSSCSAFINLSAPPQSMSPAPKAEFDRAKHFLENIMKQTASRIQDRDGEVSLSTLAIEMSAIGVGYKEYGFSSFKKMVLYSGLFQVKDKGQKIEML